MKPKKLSCIAKISKSNFDRIDSFRQTGYEPNDFIINKALDLLEKNSSAINKRNNTKEKPIKSVKLSNETLERISLLKTSGYEPNDFIIGKALDLLEKAKKK